MEESENKKGCLINVLLLIVTLIVLSFVFKILKPVFYLIDDIMTSPYINYIIWGGLLIFLYLLNKIKNIK
jgi:hypothetical protein